MTDHARLNASLRAHEGVEPNLYICPSNKLSIGVGRNVEDRPFTGAELRELYDAKEITITLTPAGITRVLGWDIRIHDSFCKALIDNWQDLDEVRRTVIAEMVFQLGPSRFAGFKEFIAAINRKDFVRAAAEGLDSKWANKDSPERAKQLMNILERGTWS